ncbi:MAG TPA: type II toxin-antitoxin system VapB family antitoxin [Rhizobiaceae bacterium]|jgi:antitoxin VapB|nr:type II toxin-antitoxin system VapB family antitoxin [Rhizobiaceae bacterium]
MAIHVQDKEADRMLREFARRRGVGITEAIKLAVKGAEKSDRKSVEELRRRIEPILAQVRPYRTEGSFEEAMKFIDDNWDD